MRIRCPGCTAEYEVPTENLRSRRKVRCSRCDTQWVPQRDAEPSPSLEEVIVEPAPPAESAMDRLAAAPPPRPPATLRAAWAITALLLVGSAAAAVTWRREVTRAWPPSGWILGGGEPAVTAAAQPPHAGADH